MKFSTKIILCSAVPAGLFILGLIGSIGGLVYAKSQFDNFIRTEQRISVDLTEMYAQGLQMGQALRNIVLDPSNPKALDNLNGGRKSYDKAYADVVNVAKGTPFEAGVNKLPALRAAHAAAQEKVYELVQSKSEDTVKVLNSLETPAWRELRGELLKQIEFADTSAANARADVYQNSQRAIVLSIVLACVAVLVAVFMTVYVQRTLKQELGGDPAEARDALSQIADGDLSSNQPWSDADTNLMGGLVRMQASLRRLVGQVRQSTDSITTASSEIAAGSQDLSSRTESQASSLEETAASMEQLGATVKQNADNARQGNQLAQSASTVAVQGGEVVAQVVDTMKGCSRR